MNWKTLTIGIIAMLALILILPENLGRFVPLLVVLICPLSMMVMMKCMHDMGEKQQKTSSHTK